MIRISRFGALFIVITLAWQPAASVESTPSHDELHAAYLIQYSGNTRSAIGALDDVLDQYSASSDLWEIKGSLHLAYAGEVNIFRKRGQLEQALAAYEEAATINPQALRAQSILFAFYDLLPESLGGGEDKFKQKSAELERISSSLLSHAKGIALMMDGDNDAALNMIRVAVESAPAGQGSLGPDVYIALVRLLLEEEQPIEAWSYLQEAIGKYPNYGPLQYQHARYKVLQEEVSDDVIADLYSLIENYSELPAKQIPEYSYLMLARAYQISGASRKAETYYQRVQSVAPGLVERSGFDAYFQN